MYIALYQNVTKEVRENCGRVAQTVLLELANYANALGVCWPGKKRLSLDCGYSEDTVESGLQRLIEADYVREHYRWSSVRQRWEFEAYQISPEVLFIREELYSEALRAYDYCNTNVRILTRESQPTTEPSLKNQQTQPESGEPTTTTTKTPEMEKPDFSTAPSPRGLPPVQPQKSQKPGQEQKPESAAQAATPAPTGATQNNPPRSAPPPLARLSYAPFVNALEDESAEDCAFDLWNETGASMPMPVARYLVATRGESVCRAAIKNYQRNAAGITNPPGYVRALIERAQVDPAYDGLPVRPSAADDDSWF